MALPNIMRRLFRNGGYGPLLKPEIIPFATDLASNAAGVAASTEWVNDLAAAAVYLDPAGSDDNDGLSSSTPVRTFFKAIDIATAKPSTAKYARIIVAGGDYSGDVDINRCNLNFYLTGSVTINGYVHIADSSIVISGDSGSEILTIYGISKDKVFRVDNSNLHSALNINVKAKNSSRAASFEARSFIDLVDFTLIADGGTISDGVVIGDGSCLSVYATLYVKGVNSGKFTTPIFVWNFSKLYAQGLQEEDVVGQYGLRLGRNSECYIYSTDSTSVIYTGSVFAGIYLDASSFCYFDHSFTVNSRANSTVFGLYSGSGLYISSASGETITINSLVSTDDAIRVLNNSWCTVVGSGALKINGAYGSVGHGTVWAQGHSYFHIDGAISLSGNATGKRYTVDYFSYLDSNGRGANGIPGSTAGTVGTHTALYS